MTDLEIVIGYKFKDLSLLERALTHSSYANENGLARFDCNERLEFLGDSVLGFFVAEHLYKEYPKYPEGEMTKMRAELVCEQSLFAIAESLFLGSYLRLGRGEEQGGGRSRPSILADALEALLAAIYLDGGPSVALKFFKDHILTDTAGFSGRDYKTALQELVQQGGGESPSYIPVKESGPDHNKIFEAEVLINGKPSGRGIGRTKKESEQEAAKNALKELCK
ncbi:MAG: ribonuclease III [Clostridiales bacterium]|nr:ribonuclease III [Clostridiales bacterium]